LKKINYQIFLLYILERSHFVSSELSTSTRPELTSASKIIAGGRALKSGENFQILYDLADKIGAAGNLFSISIFFFFFFHL